MLFSTECLYAESLKDILYEYRQSRDEQRPFYRDRLPTRVKSFFYRKNAELADAQLFKAEESFSQKKHLDALSYLSAIDTGLLSVDDFKKYLRIRFLSHLALGHSKEIRRSILGFSSHRRYMTFLDEIDIFYQVFNFLRKDTKTQRAFVQRSLAKFPYTEASIAAFTSLQGCDSLHKIGYRTLRKIALSSALTPGLEEWVVSLVDQDALTFDRSDSKVFYQARLLQRLGRDDLVIKHIENNKFDKLSKKHSEKLSNFFSHRLLDENKLGYGLSQYFISSSQSKLGYLQLKRYSLNLLEHGLYRDAGKILGQIKNITGNAYVKWSYFWSFIRSKNLIGAASTLKRMRVPPLDSNYREMVSYWRDTVNYQLGRSDLEKKDQSNLLNHHGASYYAVVLANELGIDDRSFHSPKLDSNRSTDSSTFDARKWRQDRKSVLTHTSSRKNIFALAKEQGQTDSPWEVEFPRPYFSWVSRVAKAADINPYLIYSLMRAESFYNKDAESHVGASGLMQIMPTTGGRISEQLDDDLFRVEDLRDPFINTLYAAHYLRFLLDHFDNNVVTAAGAYNAGPKKMNEWLAICDECSLPELVETVNYSETRRYMKKIVGFLGQYGRIYDGITAPRILSNAPKPSTSQNLY